VDKEAAHRRLVGAVVRSIEVLAGYLLLDSPAGWRGCAPGLKGRFVLDDVVGDPSVVLNRVLHTPWLGPGLVIALLLLVTLRGVRRAGTKPLHRMIRPPELERYRGVIPKRHRDLEV
jgi:hypothetical protein